MSTNRLGPTDHSMESYRTCPICEIDWTTGGVSIEKDLLTIYCGRRCGTYRLNSSLYGLLKSIDSRDSDPERYRLKRYLGCYTRQSSDSGQVRVIREDDWLDRAYRRQAAPVHEKLNKLLRLIERRCVEYRWRYFDPEIHGFLVDEPWPERFKELAEHLRSEGYIAVEWVDAVSPLYRLTVKGRVRLDALRRSSHPEPSDLEGFSLSPSRRLLTRCPTPEGTKWADITIVLHPEEAAVRLVGKSKEQRYGYAAMGFEHVTLRRPLPLWEYFLSLAGGARSFPPPNRKIQKRIQRLNKMLMDFFNIEGSPIEYRRDKDLGSRYEIKPVLRIARRSPAR